MSPRRLLLALAVLLSVTTVASAAPVTFNFDDVPPGEITGTGPYANRGLETPYSGCMTTAIYDDYPTIQARSRPRFLGVTDQDICGGYLRMTLADPLGPAAAVQFAIKGRLGTSMPPTATVTVRDRTFAAIETRPVELGDWQLVTFRPPASRPIRTIEIETAGAIGPVMLIDDVLVSTLVPRPKATITSGPSGETEAPSTTFTFAINADTARTVCSLDGRPAQPCSQTVSPINNPVGRHTMTVTAIDHFGVADPSPPTATWTIVAPRTPPTSPPTTPPSTPPTTPPAPSCTGAPDSDGDGITDNCDLVGLPAGTPPVPGERASVSVLSGEVFIKLPSPAAGSRSADSRGNRAAEPEAGYVPLKGVSVVPVGSTLDTRAGAVNVITATGASDKGAPKQAGSKVSAAIFQIRQRRALRKTKKHRRIPPSPTDLILKNPEGAIQAARCSASSSRETVRSLSATIPKGVVRVSGFASRAVADKANTTLRVVDRCDGTFTEVGAGRVTVTRLKGGRTVRVRGGGSYFVRGNLLRVEGRKGR